jgi:hypothetical protein
MACPRHILLLLNLTLVSRNFSKLPALVDLLVRRSLQDRTSACREVPVTWQSIAAYFMLVMGATKRLINLK